ncbi:MAG: hypothetical protein WEA10_07385 [Actinomycetota bacterium]
MPTYYADASVPIDVPKALALVRDDILYPGAPGCPVRSTNVDDEDWLRVAGEQDWVVVMKDDKIRFRRWERDALMKAGVRAFCMTTAGNYTRWRTLQLLAQRWDAMEEIATMEAGPYVYGVTQAGVRPLRLE